MTRFPLLRRRSILLPTLWGWLFLLGVAMTLSAVAGRHIHPFLALNDPVPQAKTLVVEGWMSEDELDQAATEFRKGGYDRIVTTGGPIQSWPRCNPYLNFADWAAGYLKAHGLSDAAIAAVPAPASAQDRTFLSAVRVRDWANTQNLALQSFNVFSSGTHARRSRMLYQIAFGPNVKVGILAAQSRQYDDNHWWRTSLGAKAVVSETIYLLWTTCCFNPGLPGSHEEVWGQPLTARTSSS